MNAHVGFDPADSERWRSVGLSQAPDGYIISETPDRFAAEAITEIVCRCVGIALVVAAFGQLLLPTPMLLGNPATTKGLLLAAFSATGLVLFAFATRGFRKQAKINLAERELEVSSLNGYGTARIAVTVSFRDIESLYVRRPTAPGGQAALHLRQRGIPPTVCLIRGREGEVEALHQRLCRDLRMAMTPRAPRALAKAKLFSRRPVTAAV